MGFASQVKRRHSTKTGQKHGAAVPHEDVGAATSARTPDRGNLSAGDQARLLAAYQEVRLAAAAGTLRCVLCNGRCAAFSLFAPFDSRNFGAAVGKRRFLFYGMCHAHQANEHAQACEDKLSRDLATSTIGTRPGDAVQ